MKSSKSTSTECGTDTFLFPESVLGDLLQITTPFVPSFLLPFFHVRVLLTSISFVSSNKSVVSSASNSLIRNAEAKSVLQIILKRRFAQILNVSVDYLVGNSDYTVDKLDNIELLFRMNSKGLSDEEKEIFKKELIEFMEKRKKAFGKRK